MTLVYRSSWFRDQPNPVRNFPHAFHFRLQQSKNFVCKEYRAHDTALICGSFPRVIIIIIITTAKIISTVRPATFSIIFTVRLSSGKIKFTVHDFRGTTILSLIFKRHIHIFIKLFPEIIGIIPTATNSLY
jgi:hypothetical protein